MTDRSTWIAEQMCADRLRTPEGQAQDCLGHSLPAAVRQAATTVPPKPNRYADEGNGRRLKNCPCELDGREYSSLDTMAVILDITDGEAYRQVMERGKFLKKEAK